MDFIVCNKTYRGDPEGWTTKGTIMNVGTEHREGLKTVAANRAKELVQRGLCAEYLEGDPVPKPDKGDPIKEKLDRLNAQRDRIGRRRATSAVPQERQDTRRQTKVDPPAQDKGKTAPAPAGGKQNPRPPAPRRASAASSSTATPPAPPAPNTSPAGGPTGQAQSSASSSPVDPAAKKSTGQPRGMRRGTPEHGARSASARSTKAGASTQRPTPSTAPTGAGGASAKDADDSKD